MRLLGPCTAGGEDFCKRGIERTGRPAATLHTSAAADATRSIRMQFVPGCYRAGRANYGANTTSVTLSRIGYRCNRHRFLRNFQSQSVPDKPQFIQPRKLRTRNPATSSGTKRPGSYPASLSRTFSPNLRASCKSATSGRPAGNRSLRCTVRMLADECPRRDRHETAFGHEPVQIIQCMLIIAVPIDRQQHDRRSVPVKSLQPFERKRSDTSPVNGYGNDRHGRRGQNRIIRRRMGQVVLYQPGACNPAATGFSHPFRGMVGEK